MNETGTPRFDEAKEVFVDEKKIPFLEKQGDGKLSDGQMEEIETAIKVAQGSQTESKPINLQGAAVNERDYSQPQFLYQTLSGQMRYGGVSQQDIPSRMLRMEGPEKEFKFFKEPALTPEQVQSATEMAKKFTTLNSAQMNVFFQSLAPEKLKQVQEAAMDRLFINQLIDKVIATGKPQETIAALKKNLLRYKELPEEERGLAGGSVKGVVDKILKDSKLDYPFPRRDIGSGPKAINDSDGRKNYGT